MVPGDTRERSEISYYTSVQSIEHGLTKHGVSARITTWSSGELPQSWSNEHKWPSICETGIRGAELPSKGTYVGTKTNSKPPAPPKHAGPVNLIVSGAAAEYSRVSESRGVVSAMYKVQSCGGACHRFSDEG